FGFRSRLTENPQNHESETGLKLVWSGLSDRPTCVQPYSLKLSWIKIIRQVLIICYDSFQLQIRKTQKELPDFLRDYNLPADIFSSNIISYEFEESTSKLIVHMSSPCEASFKDSSVLRYANRVKATVSRGKLSGIEGLKTKVIVPTSFGSPPGVKKCRAKDAHEFPKHAMKVDEF
ncbi:hypothetical protein V2J09_014946, partial [Rumex salicifolius]